MSDKRKVTGKRKAPILLTSLLIPLIFPVAQANEAQANENSSHKIWQDARYNQQHNQQKNEADLIISNTTSTKSGTSSIVIYGKKFKVENNIKDIGQALYLAINYRQWQDVRRFLIAYQKLPAHDPLLIDFARGGLAHFEGNLALAASYYQKILRQKPNFTRIKLELARTYFEDHKNRESGLLFEEVSKQHQLPKMVLKNIDSYLEAITRRNGWHGSFSFGYTYGDNINMSPNQKPICLLSKEGKCVIERKSPKPIKDWGVTYSATLSRHYQLIGHHGIFGRSLIYGENYRHYHDENKNMLLLVGGYNYKSRTQNFAFGPLFEYQQHAGNTEYHAIGAKMEWQWFITNKTTLNIELEHKKLSYQPRYRKKDGEHSSSYFNLSHAISEKLVLFGSGSWSYQNNQQPAMRYQQWKVNAGIAGQLYSHINGSLFFTLKKQQFGAYSPLLGARRKDNEQIYTASIKFPATKILGMTPSLTFRHRHNRSNVNWLYNYDKNEVQIQLEKYF
ncbi:porin family protein [Xenorhabdus sp. XENO-10]|uniref:Porin family protein n=1 Tax=Xenorhabdus yunnanensis TaxID=3025878 RepID=A0ABT5LDN0_9GAMM|nr:porin family protein [Xenorhabdus yunnanensis]MDC9588648.1 porin family protein [Xenorhabdus yunnanensis]